MILIRFGIPRVTTAAIVLYMARSPRRVGTYTAAVVEQIREEVDRLELTHAELAERTGIPRSTISKLLKGDQAMDVEDVALFAAALQLSVADLFAAAERRQGL